jgi:hypothetical protein
MAADITNALQDVPAGRSYAIEKLLLTLNPYQPNRENIANKVAVMEATSDTTVIWVLMDGPAVSLKGSPTVSPITAAL